MGAAVVAGVVAAEVDVGVVSEAVVVAFGVVAALAAAAVVFWVVTAAVVAVVFWGVSALQFWASGGVGAATCRAFNRRENAAGSGKRHNADRPKNRQRQIILGMKPEILAKFVRKKRNMMRRAIRLE